MGLQLPWTIEMMGIDCPAAYVRLHGIAAGSEIDAGTGDLVRGPLVATFLVYYSQEARLGNRDAVGQASVKIPRAEVDWTSDLDAQAWAALKARAAFQGGKDIL